MNWIACADRLPDVDPQSETGDSLGVLVWVQPTATAHRKYPARMDVMYIQRLPKFPECWHDWDDTYEDLGAVTHWMPLPYPPQQEAPK